MTWKRQTRAEYVDLSPQKRPRRLPPFPVLGAIDPKQRDLALSILCTLSHGVRKRPVNGPEHVQALLAWDRGEKSLQDVSEALQAMLDGVRGYGGYCDVPIRFLKAAVDLGLASPQEAVQWGVP